MTINVVSTMNQVFMILLVTYVLGLFWYRLSDYILHTIGPVEDDDYYWVVVKGLRHHECSGIPGEKMPVIERVVISMYFMLTTLSTVGYGDNYPISITEKAATAVLQILGVTIFSMVMNSFIEIVMTMTDQGTMSNEDELTRWFTLIKKIINRPDSPTAKSVTLSTSKDISSGLKREIEMHFLNYWENDRI
jgi:hypothetical protein